MLKERKQYVTIAMGCSGGRHRSVYMAERLALWIRRQGWAEPAIAHREPGIVNRFRAGEEIDKQQLNPAAQSCLQGEYQ
jgi:UPF0042 nucleotide-binding protein